MNIYEKIYQKLERLGVMKITDSIHLNRTGYMDLVIEKLGENHYSLTHYYELNGDLGPDPDMEVKIMPEQRMAEALSYQDTFGYRRVYDGDKIDAKAKKDLNVFLDHWLSNLIDQGFQN